MKQKIIVLVVTLLICLSSIVLISNDFEVEATTEGGGSKEGEDAGVTGLDYDYMWDKTENLSDIVHQYPPGLIPKGRSFGTWGDRKAADYIEGWMNDLNLENVEQLQIGPLCSTPLRKYSNKIDITDFLLHIDREDYPFPNDVPIKESFVFSTCLPETIGGSLTHNFILEDADDIRIRPTHDNWPLSGLFTNCFYNLSCGAVNDYVGVVGNATFINSSDELPVEQDTMVFLIKEEEGCEDILDNITNALGVIVVNDGAKYEVTNYAESCNFSFARVYSSDTNYSNIIQKIENEIVLVDNVYDNEILTFTYNISCCSNWPSYNFVCSGRALVKDEVSEEPKLGDWNKKTLILRVINSFSGNYKCKGVIYYDTFNETHYMNNNNPFFTNGGWFRLFPGSFPSLPMFSVNRSVGTWLEENSSDSNCTVTGYVNQEYLKENWISETPGVEAYNVIGNLTIEDSPGDAVVVISNRYDAWWDEGPHDSGAGAGIVLAIAKYFDDYSITPKVNISFLETTGEEFLFRGAQHFSDSHPNSNFTYWIGFDQLGIDLGDLDLYYKDEETRDICQAIANESDFPERANYNVTTNMVNITGQASSEDTVFYQRDLNRSEYGINSPFPCSTICFVKAGEGVVNPYRHRTGMNYSEGDALKNINQSDLNLTLELAWNITKYFTVNPDCWFENISYEGVDQDNDGDDLPDSIKANYNIRTILPEDLIMINASLINVETEEFIKNEKFNFSVLSDGTYGNITIKLPDIKGFYRLYLDLYNSSGRINEIVDIGSNKINISDNSSVFQLFPPFGNTDEGGSAESVHNYIRGSNFTMQENGVADSITAYIRTAGFDYNPGPKYKCLIYRQNQSGSVLMGEATEEKEFDKDYGGPEYSWITFNFSSPPELERGTNYIICCWGKSLLKAKMGCDSASSRGFRVSRLWGLSPPDPADFTSENELYSIYCSFNYTIPLSVGWNLITIPIENSWYASDLADNIDSCTSVSGWDAIEQTYNTYIVGGPPSFDFQLADGYGYFVDVDSESTFIMDGTVITGVSVPLEIGWNLIGWFHTYEASAYSLSDNISDCTSVSMWDATLQTYKTYIVGGPPTFDYTIFRGMGLFADVNSESTWSGEGGYGSPLDEGDGDGGEDSGSSPGLPYTIYGRSFYGNTSIPAIDANVTITNGRTSEEIFTTVNIDEFWYYKYLDDFSSGWEDEDEISISISGIDMYSDWNAIEYIMADESMGCQQVDDIILSSESTVIIRYDNGTMEEHTPLEDVSDEAIKTININSSVLENATNISLWTYGIGYGKYSAGNSHILTVNSNRVQTIYFNSIDKFGSEDEFGEEYSWQSFDINTSWLSAGLNTFNFIDRLSNSTVNNLYLGIDIENDYDRSQWKIEGDEMPPPEECEGELMILIEAEYS